MSAHPPGEDDYEDLPTPLLFKVMVVLATVYLGWRLVQGVVWLFQVLSG